MNDWKTELRRDLDQYEHLLGNWRMASELFRNDEPCAFPDLDSSASLPLTPLPGGADNPSANES